MEKELRPITYFILAAVLLAAVSLPFYFFPREKLFSRDNPFNNIQASEMAAESAEVST